MFDWFKPNDVLWLIPLAPLLACVWIVLVGQVVRRQYAHRPVVLAFAVSLAAAVYLLTSVVPGGFGSVGEHGEHAEASHAIVTTIYQWIQIGQLDVAVTLRADAMSALMLVMVTSVSLLVAIFASGYMKGDPGYPRFFAAIALFVFSMCMLVLAGNFLLMFVFWEAVGLCSYLLIGFWFQKPSAAAAAKKAFVVNRIGDFGFILGVFMVWTTFGTLDFDSLFGNPRLIQDVATQDPAILTTICLLLFVGAIGKSAQFPLHVWLPDAMEGPTPVSALIHAATMVTAGVYLVARCTPFFVYAPTAQMFVAGIGAATALIAAITALTQYDLKRVLAYSTVSQLGYMFLGLGVGTLGGITAGMFHLFTHAFFKGLLFLAAGSVMHAMGGILDMRRIGGLRKLMPITHVTFWCGALALAGVVPFAGFWSKDAIFAAIHDRMHGDAIGPSEWFYPTLYYAGLFTALMTAFYTFRALFLTFYGEEQIPHEAGHHAHESPPNMWIPLAILSVFAVGIGAWFEYTHGFANFLGLTPSLSYAPVAATGGHHEFHMNVAALSTVIALSGVGAAAYLYLGDRHAVDTLTRLMRPAYWLSSGKFFIDQIYGVLILWPIRTLSAFSAWFDQNGLDGLVNQVGRTPLGLGSMLRALQNGMVQFYALVMVLGMLVLLVGTLWR